MSRESRVIAKTTYAGEVDMVHVAVKVNLQGVYQNWRIRVMERWMAGLGQGCCFLQASWHSDLVILMPRY